MGRKLSPFEKELYQRVDEVMHFVWDPIGVASCPEARDEYHAYLPQVFGMVLESKNAEDIARYLVKVEDERMSLTPNPSKAEAVAALLLDWKRLIQAKHRA